MYSDLEPWQKDELEVWQRGWITKIMMGDVKSEENNVAIPPHQDSYCPKE